MGDFALSPPSGSWGIKLCLEGRTPGFAFSAESSLLVSGGADWTVRCWDVKGAGGLPSKTRENGVNGLPNGVNGMVENGIDGAHTTGSNKEHEENIQT